MSSPVGCLLCKGADKDENFDYCRACGRTAAPLPAANAAPPLSPLGLAIKRARGAIEPEDVPDIIRAMNAGRSAAREAMTPSTPKDQPMEEVRTEMSSENASLSPDAKGRADTGTEPAGLLSMGRKLHDAWQAVVPPSGWGEPVKWDDFDAGQQTLWDKAAVRFACLIGPAAPAWQPIESAPRGEAVLIYSPDAEYPSVMLAELNEFVGDPDPDRWYDRWNTSGAPIDADPTHWMPLPEPPQ